MTFRPHGVTWTRSCGCFAVLQSIALGLTPRQPLNTEGGREQPLCQLKMFPAQVGYSEKMYHLCRHIQETWSELRQSSAGGIRNGIILAENKAYSWHIWPKSRQVLCSESKHVFKFQINSLMSGWETDAQNHLSYILQILYAWICTAVSWNT